METIYYNLDARRVSTCDMASGETSPQCRSYAILRRVEEKRAGAGSKVLDLEEYRRRLSGTELGAEALWEVAPSSARDDTPERRHSRRTGLALDFFATLAILAMAVVVVVCFLPFL